MKNRPIRLIDEDVLKRGFQQRKDVDITIEQERAKMRAFFEKEGYKAVLIPKPEKENDPK